MPNLWNTTVQKIYEVINGVRTKDNEFDIKVGEMQLAEKSLYQIKALLVSFNKNTSGNCLSLFK
jgi:hypothetical protein